MKFMSLLKKELREMLTVQTICMLIFMLILMYSMGGMMNEFSEQAQEDSGKAGRYGVDLGRIHESSRRPL